MKTNYFSKSNRTDSQNISGDIQPAPLAYTNSPPKEGISGEGGLDLGQLLSTIRRRWLVIAGTTLVVTAGTYFWSISRAESFKGSFQILVEPVTAEAEVVSAATGQKNTVADQDLGETQQSKSQLDYPTQIEVLYSRKLLEPVVSTLQAKLPNISYGKLKGSLDITRQGGTKAATKILVFDYQSLDPEEVKEATVALSQAYIKYSLEERQTNLKRAVQFTDQQIPLLKSQVNQLELQLQTFREQNRLVDPATLTTQVTQQYSSLQQQVMTTQLELNQKKRLYASLQRQLQQQPSSAEAGSVLSQAPEYRRLVDQLQEIETQLEVKSAQLTENHPDLIDLRAQRDRLLPLVEQKGQSVLGKRLYDQVGDISSLPYQNNLRQSLSKQLVDTQLEVQVLEARLRGSIRLRDTLDVRRQQLPKISRQHTALQRQLTIATDNLQGFLRTRESLLINAARQEVPWELVEPPGKPRPIALASLPRDLSLGSLLGLMLGLGLAILIDKASNTIHDVEELRAAVELPIIGKVPTKENLDRIAFDSGRPPRQLEGAAGNSIEEYPLSDSGYNISPFMEAFRSLNIQVQMLRPDLPVRSLVVSSCLPGEGKSTVALHLAQASAAMGKRVLLVDADLRVPKVHTLLDVEKSPGLSELTALDLDTAEVIRTIPYEEHLSILTAGTQPSDPSRFLASQRMHSLMENFLDLYDLVIYDTPPLGLSETVLLSTLTDGLLLVTKLGAVKQSYLKEILNRLEQSRVSILGVIANQVKLKESPHSTYGKYSE